eukprot:GSMAST32.ASY1.ANO1.1916.1 assembled CDS
MYIPKVANIKKLVENPACVVQDMIDGLIELNPNTRRLDGFPEIKVVVRADWCIKNNKVAIISGGGSGHEPAHIGFAGVLLIVKNYTGDRLNFGLAAEMAKAEGYNVDIVVVRDDAALEGDKQRGIAGTVLVHKIAGACAEEGKSLARVREVAAEAASRVYSMGVALSTCTKPGQNIKTQEDRLANGEMELGMGMYRGRGRSNMLPVSRICTVLLDTILEKMENTTFGSVVLINNLGGATAMEIAVVAKFLMADLRSREFRVSHLISGRLMSALDMQGVSVSILPLSRETASFIEIAKLASSQQFTTTENMYEIQNMETIAPHIELLQKTIRAVAESVISKEAMLTHWDGIVGDGDCGTTLKFGFESVLNDLPSYPLLYPKGASLVMRALSRSLRGMGGSSGALYAIGLSAAEHETNMQMQNFCYWVRALRSAIHAIMSHGGAKLGDRTMLDALLPAIDVLELAIESNNTSDWKKAVTHSTKSIHIAGAGRSAYIEQSHLGGIPDPGAMAISYIMKAISDSLIL